MSLDVRVSSGLRVFTEVSAEVGGGGGGGGACIQFQTVLTSYVK